MDNLIDMLFLTSGPILFVILIVYSLVKFQNLKLLTKGITILGILSSITCAYFWMDNGLKLKSSERFFVERKLGKYSNFTNLQVQEKLAELNQDNKNVKVKMTLLGIGFLIITVTTVTIIEKEK